MRVNLAGDDLFAGARLAENEDRVIGRRDRAHELLDLVDDRTCSDQRNGLWKRTGLGAPPLEQRLAEQGPQHVGIDRLFEEGKRAELHCLDRGFHGAVSRQHDDARRDGAAASQNLEPVDALHLQVEECDIRRLAVGEHLDRFLSAARFRHGVAAASQGFRHREPKGPIVVDDQDATVHDQGAR